MAGGFGTGLAAQTVTLRYSNWLPLEYPVNSEILLPWAEMVEEVTEGRVVVEATPMVVGSVAGQFDVIADGLADLALVVPAYTPGRFPVIDGFELPFLSDDTHAMAPAVWRTYQAYLEPMNLFDGVEVLSLFMGNAAQTFMVSRTIESLADFNGARIRAPSPTAGRALTHLGAVAVQRPANETYELASTGIIDGAVLPPESAVGFHLQDVLQRMTLLPGGLANTVLVWTVNPVKWNQISESDREAIMAISGEVLARQAGEAHQIFAESSFETLAAAGMVIDRPSESALAEIIAAVEPVRTAWIEAARAHGMEDPQAMLDFLRADIEADEGTN